MEYGCMDVELWSRWMGIDHRAVNGIKCKHKRRASKAVRAKRKRARKARRLNRS